MGLFNKFRALFRKARMEAELDKELRFHLEKQIEQNKAQGMNSEEARHAALRQFGNVGVIKEECREAWGIRFFNELAQDIRYGLRQLRRNPGFTIVAVLTLALGIGANTAIFSLIDAVMLRILPVKNPEQLVLLSWASQKQPAGLRILSGYDKRDTTGRVTSTSFSYPSFEEFRRSNRVFSSFFGFDSLGRVSVSANGHVKLADGEFVTGNYFSGLGISPILGRAITPEDERPSTPSVAVISYGLWSRRFDRSPAVVGKGITVNEAPYTIVGVAPPEFFGVTPGRSVEVWVPLVQNAKLQPPSALHIPDSISPFTSRSYWWFTMMGRLKSGVTVQQANAQLEVLFQQSITTGRQTSGRPRSTPHMQLEPAANGLAALRDKFSTPLWVLTVLVGIVLLIACANIAALLVARSAARQQEIALRLSLGASRRRLMRQLLTESVLLAALGGTAGVFFAHWAIHALVLLISGGMIPLTLRVHLNARVMEFTVVVAVLSGILFGLAPALDTTRGGLIPALKNGPGTSASGWHVRAGLGKSLVVTQVALALVLLVGAGLFIRTLVDLEHQSIGFNQHHLLLFAVDPTQNGYQGERLAELYVRLLTRLRALPGVRSATASTDTLLSGSGANLPIVVEGYKPEPGQSMNVDWNNVGPSFFKTMGIPLVLGRGVETSDTASSPKVAVVNEAFAHETLRGYNPIGQKFMFGLRYQKSNPEYEIVGIVGNAKFRSLRRTLRPTVYIPYTQMPLPLGRIHFEMRTSGNPMALVPAVRHTVHGLDPNLPIYDIKTQAQQIAETLMQERLFSQLSGFFGTLAVLLACIGLYGLMAYGVARRKHAIGIRMALGAQKGDVLKMVVGQGLKLVLIGVAMGIAGALALTRFLASQLYGVKPTDPLTFIVVSLILIGVALVACYIPARRAAKVDPMVALRYE